MGAYAQGFEDSGIAEFAITTDDLYAMIEAGVFKRASAAKVDLLDGKLIRMSPISAPHAITCTKLLMLLNHGLEVSDHEPDLMALIGGTVEIDALNAPDPDVFVARMRNRKRFFLAEDIVLMVEVSYTTHRHDLVVKRAKYAGAGIAEYWVADVERSRLHVFRDPIHGNYASEAVFGLDASVQPLFAPSLVIPMRDIF